MKRKMILPLGFVILASSCSLFQKISKRKTEPQQVLAVAIKADSPKVVVVKPYKEIITDKAVTTDGLFKVHQVNERYYFEIADSILEKDILIVNRISKGAAAVRPHQGLLGYAGDYIGENVVQFSKGPNKKLLIRRISYLEISNDSTENGMYRSILNSSLQPIVASFDIKAVSEDSSAVVIDLTDYLNGDNDVFFFDPTLKKLLGLSGIQQDKSFIQKISTFPLNTEIKTIKTYTNISAQILTYELNSSLVLLPSDPMKPRYFDQRVGYFSRGYLNYDLPQGVKPDYMITRWRLEPKTEDIGKYQKGELVEPKKPIVFYIDPATPQKWVPYLIQGVKDWQKAFEKAGFKNAIYALEAPKKDSTWSLEDARHNVIVYKASYVQNASGPAISDPRSGEILESHINWYHNVQQLLQQWYFIQASPSDPRARKMVFEDSLMGQLIRFVCAHEVGHTLGLQHNFVASSAIPVDSLRSRRYVAENSHTPSLMDYARFNYVAQPQDSIATVDLIPRIGVYDEWAVEWGYKWLPDFKSVEDEKTFMNKWIIQRLAADRRLLCLPADWPDPRNNMEDLGDDAAKASHYGIQNLKYVMLHLKDWASLPNDDYSTLLEMYRAVRFQYRMYLNHVLPTVGNLYMAPQTVEQGGRIFSFPPKEKIRSAVNFFNEELFNTPKWLVDTTLFALGTGSHEITLQREQEMILHFLLSAGMWNSLVFNETNLPKDKSYNYEALLNDLESEIWKEIGDHKSIDFSRRNLQKTYVFKLIRNVMVNKGYDMEMHDYSTILKYRIELLQKKIAKALPGYRDQLSRLHLEDLSNRLKDVLKNSNDNKIFPSISVPGPAAIHLKPVSISLDTYFHSVNKNVKSCWQIQTFEETEN